MKRSARGTIKFMFKATCVVWIFAGLLSFCTDDFWYGAMCVHHDYGAWVTVSEADCEHDGEEERICKICGHRESIEYKAYGHEYISEVTKEATIYEEGEIIYKCFRCGHEDESKSRLFPGLRRRLLLLSSPPPETIRLRDTCFTYAIRIRPIHIRSRSRLRLRW